MFPLILMFLLSVGLMSRPAHSDPHFVGVRCAGNTSSTYTQPSPYLTNLNTLLLNLKAGISTTKYSSDMVRGDSDDTTVYGFWYCRGDTLLLECRACIASAMNTIVASCPAQKDAVVWYEECVLQYANRVIFSEDEADPWTWRHSSLSVSQAFNMNSNQFGQILVNGLQGLLMQAAYNNTRRDVKFYGRQTTKLTPTQSLNGLVQCSPGVETSQQCETCLRSMLGPAMESCCGWASAWAMLFSPSCLLMYTVVTSATPTVRQTQSSTFSNSDSGKSSVSLVIGVAATFCAVGIFLAIWWWVHGGSSDKRNGRGNNRGILRAAIPMPPPPKPKPPRSPSKPSPPAPKPSLPPEPSPPPPRPIYPGASGSDSKPSPPPPRPIYPGEMGFEPRPTIYVENLYVHNYYGPSYEQ